MTTQSYWHPEDKDWMAQRKAEWRQIKPVLDCLSPRIKKRHQGTHKELFFYGRVEPSLQKEEGAEPFAFLLALFELWYHPEPSDDLIATITRKQTNQHPFRRARDFFIAVHQQSDYCFKGEYGMMGGREELLVRMLFPGFDHTQDLLFTSEWGQTTRFPMCIPPVLLCPFVRSGSEQLLVACRDNPYCGTNPYHPAQYLWDHLAAVIDDPKIDEVQRAALRRVLRELATYDTREDFPWENAGAVRFAKRLRERFEKRDFPAAMMRFWDQALEELRMGVSD